LISACSPRDRSGQALIRPHRVLEAWQARDNFDPAPA